MNKHVIEEFVDEEVRRDARSTAGDKVVCMGGWAGGIRMYSLSVTLVATLQTFIS